MDINWVAIRSHPTYRISDKGEVLNSKGQKLNPSLDQHGYRIVGLWTHQKAQTCRVHRLVADAFLSNPNKYPVVHHKDGNRSNNNAENLEWASYTTNRLQRLPSNKPQKGRPVLQISLDGIVIKEWISATEAAKSLNTPLSNILSCCRRVSNTAAGYKWTYAAKDDDFPNERWASTKCGNRLMFISDLGRVKTETGHITYGSKCGNYLVIYGQMVHRLVATAFCEKTNEDAIEVNHIDGVGTNNNVKNLEWVTKSENMQHAFYSAPMGKCSTNVLCPVRQIFPDGSEVLYPSSSAAARATGVQQPHISQVCHGQRKSAGGFVWVHTVKEKPKLVPILDNDPLWIEIGIDEPFVHPGTIRPAPIRKRCAGHKRPVNQILVDGTKVLFESSAAASRITGISQSHISDVCHGRSYTSGGFRWEFAELPPPEKVATVSVHCFNSRKDTTIAFSISNDDPIWDELGL